MSKFCIDVPKLDYVIVYNCITKTRTNARYTFKRWIPDNDTAIKWNKHSEKTEKKFIELANKCGWTFSCEIIKGDDLDV